jgi:hypothetical protein
MDVSRFQPDGHLSTVVGVLAPGAARLVGGIDPVSFALKPEMLRRKRIFGSNENNSRIFQFFYRFRIVCFNLVQFAARTFILKNPKSFGRCGKTGAADLTILRFMDRAEVVRYFTPKEMRT